MRLVEGKTLFVHDKNGNELFPENKVWYNGKEYVYMTDGKKYWFQEYDRIPNKVQSEHVQIQADMVQKIFDNSESCSFSELCFTRETNGFIKGLILNRYLTVDECRYIISELLGIDIQEEDDFYDDEHDEWQEYNEELQININAWLRGDADDSVIAQYMYDCQYDQLGMMQLIGILIYLQKIEVI